MYIDPARLERLAAVISDAAELLYKTTGYWAPRYQRTLPWNDPKLGFAWLLADEPILASKDVAGCRYHEAEVFD